MEVNADKTTKKKRLRRDLIISVIVVLVIVQAVNMFFKYRADKAHGIEMAKARDEITILQHELEERMYEIDSLGGDVQDLEIIVAELEEEKANLLDRTQYSERQLVRLKERVDGYQELLILKDQEIVKLKDVNQELVAENQGLKTEQNQLRRTLNQTEQTKQELEEQMVIAGRLKAENIRIFALNSRGRIKENEFKARNINKLRAEFNIAENNLAPIEGKDIMIRIVGPDDNILFDVATGSGTFMFRGREEFYTAKQQILFDNTMQKLTFQYDKGSEWATGRYELEVYTEDYLMGERAFMVK
ncbi:chromosome segregation protein SMC [Bacteroidota bacterium]